MDTKEAGSFLKQLRKENNNNQEQLSERIGVADKTVLHGETDKVDMKSLLSIKTKGFSVKTVIHIQKIFEKFGYEEIFGRSSIADSLKLQNSSASRLLSKLVQAEIIEPVFDHGKGKYKFKRNN